MLVTSQVYYVFIKSVGLFAKGIFPNCKRLGS